MQLASMSLVALASKTSQSDWWRSTMNGRPHPSLHEVGICEEESFAQSVDDDLADRPLRP